MTAEELMAKLEADPVYQARKAAVDAEMADRRAALRRAESPIVGDLNAAGVSVDSVWDLVNSSAPYPDALPVLLAHLERGDYPDRVLESLGRSLAVKPAVTYWDKLRSRYLAAHGPGEEEGLAVALAACATAEQLADLVELIADDSRGSSRIHFLRPIKRLGGRKGIELLESLRTDKMFGKEAIALTAGRR
jgi:hypothetical protein